MDIKKIRQDFPVLQKELNGKPIIYLDTACMALKPKQVVEAMNEYYYNFPACGERSVHKLGTEVSITYEESRVKIQKFIGAESSEEIIFTKNTTEGMNLVARSLPLKKGDIVLTTDHEHNSGLVPFHTLQKLKGIKHKVVLCNPKEHTFNLENFKKEMNKKVKLVSMVHINNLDGTSIPAEEVIGIAHDYNALVLLDGAQSAPHIPLSVKKMDVDFFAFSIHKMCGPTGVGALYGKYELLEELEPFIVGGSTVEKTTYSDSKFLKPPQKFEAGLQNYAGVIGAGAAANYISQIGKENIAAYDYKLNKIITESLKDLSEVRLLGPLDPKLRAGIYSFNIKNIDAHDVAMILDEVANIMIRSGMHCVHSWFNAHKIKGSARASTYFYNTEEEVKIFADHVRKLVDQFSK